ncbi:MAG: hypothetical protein VX065_04685 [Pseudomonadota bacterium]|nr:hypothetical protein [Pseudomonadota bacterium]
MSHSNSGWPGKTISNPLPKVSIYSCLSFSLAFSSFHLLVSWRKHLVAARFALAQLKRGQFTLVAPPMHALNKVQVLKRDAYGLESSV